MDTIYDTFTAGDTRSMSYKHVSKHGHTLAMSGMTVSVSDLILNLNSTHGRQIPGGTRRNCFS